MFKLILFILASNTHAGCDLHQDKPIPMEKENHIYRRLEGGKRFITAVYETENGKLYRGPSKVCPASCRPTELVKNTSCGYYYTSCRRLVSTGKTIKNGIRIETFIDEECSAFYWDVKTKRRL